MFTPAFRLPSSAQPARFKPARGIVFYLLLLLLLGATFGARLEPAWRARAAGSTNLSRDTAVESSGLSKKRSASDRIQGVVPYLFSMGLSSLADAIYKPLVSALIPTLGNYPNVTVITGGNTTVTPDALPVNAARITAVTSTNFKGTLTVNPITGVVTVTNAHVAGTYTVMVTAFDSDGLTATKSFVLTVNNPANCLPADFNFRQPLGSPVGAGNVPYAVVVGDFNNDGKQDLAVANLISKDVTILLGNGNGGFSGAAGSPISVGTGNPAFIAIGDFNGDGHQDLAVASSDSGFSSVTILLGNGSGGFSPASGSPITVGNGTNNVAVGDFNGDGRQDLAVSSSGSGGLMTILLGNGSGGFSPASGSPFDAGGNLFAVKVGDFNNDGNHDLAVVSNVVPGKVTILLGNGSGGFSSAAGSPVIVGSVPQSLTVSDFNGDGAQDLAVANVISNNVTILLGNGSGGFVQAAGSPVGVGAGPRFIVVGDFNGDGKQDLTVSNQDSNNLTILLGNGSGGFSPAPSSPISAGGTPDSVAVGDFNGDGKQDFVVANQNPDNVTILLNNCVRVVRVVNASATSGVVSVPIELVAQGDENALGFSLSYDPALLSNPQAMLGSDAGTAILNINPSQTGQGRLGVALALPIGQTFAVGTRQLLNVTFTIAAALSTTSTMISFSDQPVARQVVNASGAPLFTSYTEGTVVLTSRFIRATSLSAAAGGSAAVPIELIAQGNEHALGFSLSFDPALLSNPQATLGSDAGGAILNTDTSQIGQGRFGITLALPAGQTFTAGTRAVLLVTFAVAPVITGSATTISFVDQPLVRRVVNTSNGTLPTSFAGASVIILVNFEADVSPRSAPDKQVTIADWVQVGRFAAGLDATSAGGEFQQADCAPRNSLGDGQIDVTDWAQAGRFAAGLDPLTLAGGPTAPNRPAIATSAPLNGRIVRAVDTTFVRGQLNNLVIQLDAQGNENTLGFSLNYDTSLLSFAAATLGSGASGATLIVNATQTASGRLGIAVGLPGGQHFATGTQQIVLVSFTAQAAGPIVTTPVTFGDQPVLRRVADVNANPVSATYVNALLTVAPPGCSYTVSPLSQSVGASGGMGTIMVTTGTGCGWNAMSNDGFITITGGSSGTGNGMVNYTVAANGGFVRGGTISVAGQSFTVAQNGLGLQFYPLPAPVRLLDTRFGASPNACSQPNAPITGQTSRTQPGRNFCTIPANAQALTGNVTTVNSGGGFLTLYPSDAQQPTVASTNYGVNEVINNVFTVGLGADGAFKIYAHSTTEVVVDVTGYYAPPGMGGLYFHPLPAPVRLLETRPGLPVGCVKPGVPLMGMADSTQQAISACTGIPAAARAIVGNATTVDPQGVGFLTLFPGDAARPLVASSNYTFGQVVNGPFSVGLAPNGEFKIYTPWQTHLVVDVLGYYSTEAVDVNGAGLLFYPLPRPVRLLETRPGLPVGCFKPGMPLLGGSETVQTARGVCDGVMIPNDALGVVGNATVVFPQGLGFLTLWPSTAVRPTVAMSNYKTGDVGNRHFIAGLGNADGAFKIYTHATTDLVIDLSGYFAP